MKKISQILIVSSVTFVILSASSLAYLDPGTGGMIINTIWPLIVTLFAAIGAFFVKWFWKPIKRSFSKLIVSTKKENLNK